MKFIFKLFAFIVLPVFAQIEFKYDHITNLDTSILNEVSGIQTSIKIGNRLYYINDSGDSAQLYYTENNNFSVKSIALENVKFTDTEDLTILQNGCNGVDCIIIGDIGNNKFDRDTLTLYFVQEKKYFGKRVAPYHILEIRFHSNNFNLEAMAIEPKTKDLYFLSKKSKENDVIGISQLFRIKYKDLFSHNPITLEFVDDIDFRELLSIKGKKERVTSMDFSSFGKLSILTSKQILLADYQIKSKKIYIDSFTVLNVPTLKKQEAISFIPKSFDFFYTTESKKSDAPLYKVDIH